MGKNTKKKPTREWLKESFDILNGSGRIRRERIFRNNQSRKDIIYVFGEYMTEADVFPSDKTVEEFLKSSPKKHKTI